MNETSLSLELLQMLGPDRLTVLAEQFGGTRLYIPTGDGATKLKSRIGAEAAALLARRYGGDTLRVPLAREHRARQYRARGLSNAEIAVKLGITETGVDKLFARMHGKPAKGQDPRQLHLFT